MTSNAAERALRDLTLGRKARLFASSSRGGRRAAFVESLIVATKLEDVDHQAWLTVSRLTRPSASPSCRALMLRSGQNIRKPAHRWTTRHFASRNTALGAPASLGAGVTYTMVPLRI